MFLNPAKAFEPLWQISSDLLEEWCHGKTTPSFHMNFVLHLSGVIERNILNQSLEGSLEQVDFVKKHPQKEKFDRHLLVLEETFHLTISMIERYYLLMMLEQQENTHKIH